jgi:hypothetical protein
LSVKNVSQKFIEIKNIYIEGGREKKKFIELYGFVQKIFLKSVIGNFEYIKDKYGTMHYFVKSNDRSVFCNEMKKLSKLLTDKNIPLLYVQNPPREIEGFTYFYNGFELTEGRKNHRVLLKSLQENNIEILDIESDIVKFEDPFNFYFKTDVHMTTNAELFVLKEIIARLQIMNIHFSEEVLSYLELKNYEKVSKPFFGNYAESSGKFFAKADIFDFYIPKFSTDMILIDPSASLERKGSFEKTIMVSPDEKQGYYIVNYMRWPSPYYEIYNNKVHKNRILFISDSVGLRTAAYFSLLVNHLVFLDNRYFKGVSYIEKVLSEYKFDAVIVLQGERLKLSGKRLFY